MGHRCALVLKKFSEIESFSDRWSLVIESPKGNEPKLISESNFNSQNEAIVKQMMPFTDNMKIG